MHQSRRRETWRSDSNGALLTERGGFQLVIPPSGNDGYVRFLVLDNRKGAKQSQALVASGTEEDLSGAIAAAERMSARLML